MRRRRHIASLPALIILFGALAILSAGGHDLPFAPERFAPGPGAPSARAAPEGALAFEFPAGAGDRVFWDLPIARLDPAASLLELEISCETPAALRAITLHLRDGDHWLSTSAPLGGPGRQTLRFPRADFQAESGSPEWSRATTLRLSFWKGAGGAATVLLHSLRLSTPPIAIVRGTELTAPGESAFAAQCAERARRLFERAGLATAFVSDDFERLDLRHVALLVLPYNPALSDRQTAILERFARRHRLAVFYLANPRLAQRLGFKPLPYATQSEPWNTVEFYAGAAPGLPPSMAHFTQHLLPVRANHKLACHLGRWRNADGIPDHSLPACAVSPKGLWFSHIPPLATPAAVRWLLAALATTDPATYAAARDRLTAESISRDAAAAAILAATPPAAAGEIHAVWTRPLSLRTRDATLGLLGSNGVNAVFEHLSTAGFAHYHAEDDVPRSDLGRRRNRHFLPRAIQIARANGIALHAWVTCWNLDGLPEDLLAPLRGQGRLMQDAHGNELPWLCPLHPANRQLLLGAVRDLAGRGIDGIHLDYIRYPGRDACFCPRHRFAVESATTAFQLNWPADVLPGGALAATFDEVRRDDLTAFVAELAAAARQVNPAIRISAAVYPTPAAAAANGQDWPRWLRDDSLDFACPMLYAPDAGRFAALLDQALAAAPPGKLLPGLGVSADESQLDALAAAEQIAAARQRRCPGFVFFQLDSDLAETLLPALFRP